ARRVATGGRTMTVHAELIPTHTRRKREYRTDRMLACAQPAPSFYEEWAGVGGQAGYELTPDTEPEAIAAAQRAEVARAREFLTPLGRATAKRISDLVVLPVWVVRRRLAELGA